MSFHLHRLWEIVYRRIPLPGPLSHLRNDMRFLPRQSLKDDRQQTSTWGRLTNPEVPVLDYNKHMYVLPVCLITDNMITKNYKSSKVHAGYATPGLCCFAVLIKKVCICNSQTNLFQYTDWLLYQTRHDTDEMLRRPSCWCGFKGQKFKN